MKPKPDAWLEAKRICQGPMRSDASHGMTGAFLLPYGMQRLFVISSTGLGWDHVSVTVRDERRCPTWDEMAFVKRQFFSDDECAIQYMPADADNISYHPYCLHIFRPQDVIFPMPPHEMVGPRKR